MPLPLEKRKIIIFKLRDKYEEFKIERENKQNELADKLGNEVLKLHLEVLRTLNLTAASNRISSYKEHYNVSAIELEELLEEQENLIQSIENSKEQLSEDLHKMKEFFNLDFPTSQKFELLELMDKTLCSNNKIVREKSRRFIQDLIVTNSKKIG